MFSITFESVSLSSCAVAVCTWRCLRQVLGLWDRNKDSLMTTNRAFPSWKSFLPVWRANAPSHRQQLQKPPRSQNTLISVVKRGFVAQQRFSCFWRKDQNLILKWRSLKQGPRGPYFWCWRRSRLLASQFASRRLCLGSALLSAFWDTDVCVFEEVGIFQRLL